MRVLTRVEDLQISKKVTVALPPLIESGKQLVQSVTDAFLSAVEE